VSTAQTTHDWIRGYNWDDGFVRIWPIAQSDETEFATALLIYWRLDGPLFMGQPDTEAARLHSLVESRLRAGRYARGSLRYDPVADNHLSRVQVARLKRDGFPAELVEPAYDA
jgi:hypothetical protein